MFTLTDKTLIDRAARLLREQASLLHDAQNGLPWGTNEAGQKAKLQFDRLMRDERDLRSLAKRLTTHFGVKPAARKTAETTLEPSISEQREMGVLGGMGDAQSELGIAHG